MKRPPVKSILKYGITSAIGIGLAVLYFVLRIPFSEIGNTPAVVLYLNLCDACTIPGVLFLMLGCLVALSTHGALDGVSYLVSYLVKSLIPGQRDTVERYGDYIERKRNNRASGYGFLFVVGAVFTALAGIFMMLFYSVY